MTNPQPLRIKEGRTELTTFHNTSDLTFIHPAYGPDTYANVGTAIEQAGLARSTMAQTASLVYAAFNSSGRYSDEIKEIMKERLLWAFTGNLYAPNKGVYIQDNPEIRDNMPFMEESDLARRLEEGDEGVIYVPFGFKTGEMTPLELAKNAYVKALAGAEGAEKLAEVADKYKKNPYLWSLESVKRPLTRVSALVSNRGLGDRLCIDGDNVGSNRLGYAFGVSKAGEASRA